MRVLKKRSSLSMKGFNLVFFVLCLVIQPLCEKRVEMVVSLTRANQGEDEVFHGCGEIWELPKSPVPLKTPSSPPSPATVLTSIQTLLFLTTLSHFYLVFKL